MQPLQCQTRHSEVMLIQESSQRRLMWLPKAALDQWTNWFRCLLEVPFGTAYTCCCTVECELIDELKPGMGRAPEKAHPVVDEDYLFAGSSSGMQH